MSFIKTLPLSIKSVKLEANNIAFNNKAKDDNINESLDQNSFDVSTTAVTADNEKSIDKASGTKNAEMMFSLLF